MARLGEFLVKEGLISEAALQAATAAQKDQDFLGAVLVRQGALSEEDLARAVEKQSGSPRIDLERIPLEPGLAGLVPQTFAEKTRSIPIRVDKQCLYIGAVDPSNVVAWDELAALTDLAIRTFTVMESQLGAAWAKVYAAPGGAEDGKAARGVTTTSVRAARRAAGERPGAIERLASATGIFRPAPAEAEPPPAEPIVPEKDFNVDTLAGALDDVEVVSDEPEEEASSYDMLAAASTDSPSVKLVNGFIWEAVERGASDIHIEPFEDATRVRYRVDGVLQTRVELPRSNHRTLISRVKVMAALDIAERRLPQDGRVRMRIGGKPVDLRVSTLPVSHGEKVVMRVLGGTLVKDAVDQLGFKTRDLERVRTAISVTNGMLLVTGPTGSGKTTTLYTILKQLNEPGVNITTAEDPIEYEQKGILQVHVKPDIGFTFASALRAFLRQDPDIIMVGEIRDLETAEIAIKAALTGHLVLSTLHTNDSVWTIARLIDMGVPPFLVAAAVRCVVAQRLMRRLCTACRAPAGDSEYEAWKRAAPERPRPAKLLAAKGCRACSGTGYKGRVPVFEVFSLEKDEVKKVVTEGAAREKLKAAGRADGLKTLMERALEYVEDGTTTLEEAWACCAM